MSYIEKDFPIERLNEIALRESNARKPIYKIHKWWARRVGSIFRMIILATFSSQHISESELWRRFYQRFNLGGKVILDPFMGGGTSLIEALKLGCRVIGIDIHPVSWFIVKKQIESLDLKKFKEELAKLERRRNIEKIKEYYKTLCPKCYREADIIFALWVRKIKCIRCKETIPLFNSFRIASLGTKINLVFCPNCRKTMEVENYRNQVTCSKCGVPFIPSAGNVRNGKYYLCPKCGYKGNILKSVKRGGKIPETELYAIKYYCPYCKECNYKMADDIDIKRYEKARIDFQNNARKLLTPKQAIPVGKETKRVLNYNYKYFSQIFNERQLLCLSILLNEILKIEDENIGEFMLLTFSHSLTSNNTLCIWDYRGTLQRLFSTYAYQPPRVFAENNVWGTEFGMGTFKAYADQTINGKIYNLNPYEIFIKDGKSHKIFTGEKIRGKIVNNLNDLYLGNGNVLLKIQTSEDLSFIPTKSVDAVITDPPYYDRPGIYSELADFYYVWLRLVLKNRYEEFLPEYSPRAREIIVNKLQGKDEKWFVKGLTQVFTECNRVLKDEGLLIFTFHHEKGKAWTSVLSSVLNAQFFIISAYPVHSEVRDPLRATIEYDVIIVCKKMAGRPERISWETLKDKIHQRAREVLERLWLSDRDLSDEDMFVIAMGKCLELYSKHFPNIFKRGRRVQVEEAVSDIDDIIDSLLKIKDIESLPGVIDETTKIYCSYMAGLQSIRYDALHKRLSKGGIDVNIFIKEKLIEKVKNTITILKPEERKTYIEEKIRKKRDLLTIDKVHLLYTVYAEGRPIIKYLSEYGGEDVKKVSELIYKKTGDNVYANIAGVATTIPKKVKPTTLEEFMG